MLGKAFDEGITSRRATQGGSLVRPSFGNDLNLSPYVTLCIHSSVFWGAGEELHVFTLNTLNNLHVHLTQIEHTILHSSTTCCSFTKH